MPRDPEFSAHLEWLGYIQPVGLVVSPPALLQAQAHINRNVIPQHQRFLGCLPVGADEEPVPQINDFPAFVRSVLDWQDTDLIPFQQAVQNGIDVTRLEVVLPEYHETLRPTWIVPEFQSSNAATAASTHASSPVKPSATKKTANPFDHQSDDQEQDDVSEDLPGVGVADPAEPTNADRIVMLITQVPVQQDLDEPLEESDRRWHASPHARFERLLRESHVPAGLLTNGRNIRLVYAPRGETSGYLTFNVEEMTTVAGRPIFAALHMLLNSDRLFNLEKRQRLPAILAESRKYQNAVSTKLAQQVMAALYELLRGFQAADDQWNGRLLKDVLAHNPQHVYHGLLTVLMRTVFILYAEDRNLLSNHPVYTNYYSIIGLFERLRSDAGRYPDTMDQRYGAWAQLLTLFRMIYEGGSHDDLKIPARKGYLFDPDRYPFLEGVGDRVSGIGCQVSGESQEQTPTPNPHPPIPRVPDGVVYRVLNNLLVLDGERLSYRTLDVEQIGSVYEAIMGFEVEVSTGRSIAIKPVKKHGAPATINLEELLKQNATNRAKWLKERTDQDFSGQSADALKSAKSIEDLLVVLEKKIANDVTPNVVPAGAMIFQPSDERRRSGSHYTPRSLTEPIVRTTLEPILRQLCGQVSGVRCQVSGVGGQVSGESQAAPAETRHPKPDTSWQPTAADKRRYTAGEIAERIRLSKIAVENAKLAREKGVPHPSQILDLKICDPAMGSGAFLVETCRQLGDALIKSWAAHSETLNPNPQTLIPNDEDEVLYARRLIAQRCLYGVDKNDMAVDLAKLSLWLVTLAKDHAFTFLDHSLRHGDALVGLTREQIIGFHWEPKKQKQFGADLIQKRLDRATEARAKILNAREDVPYRDQEQRLAVADEALNVVRLTGDACVSAFFAGSKPKEREARCEGLRVDVEEWYRSGFDVNKRGPITQAVAQLRGTARKPQSPTPNPQSEHPIPPFHWEIEFPEVFSRENGGFDAFVGNPPFAGKNTLIKGNRDGYLDWLKTIHKGSHGNADLVAHFFRRAFSLIRKRGTFGLIATNTIGQGDTRATGLTNIRQHNGHIYVARRRVRWPGVAAVIVSIVHVIKGRYDGHFQLDGRSVSKITAYLFQTGRDDSPDTLVENDKQSFQGVILLGMGFTFDGDTSNDSVTPLRVMATLIDHDDRNGERIFPYIGGEEVNNDPKHAHRRFAINFAEWPLRRKSDIAPSWSDATEAERKTWLRNGEVPSDYPDPVAEDFPRLLEIVESKVRPERMAQNDEGGRLRWWQYLRPRGEMLAATRGLDRVIAISCGATPWMSFTFLGNPMVFANTLAIIAHSTFDIFGVLQSHVHECWARLLSSTMKDDLRYTPTDAFETFPFPHGTELDEVSETGMTYFEYRSAVMIQNNEGLTKTYNRFHDPHERSPAIHHLRELHAAMDRAVLEAYGWHDLAAAARCEFLLDYEEEGDQVSGFGDQGNDEGTGNPTPETRNRSRRRKPYRLRWPDDFRDEVLARLLELNEQRHKEEVLAGKAGVGGQASGAGDEGDDDEEFNTDSDDLDAPGPKKPAKKSAAKPKAPRKSKKSPATGQQEMDF